MAYLFNLSQHWKLKAFQQKLSVAHFNSMKNKLLYNIWNNVQDPRIKAQHNKNKTKQKNIQKWGVASLVRCANVDSEQAWGISFTFFMNSTSSPGMTKLPSTHGGSVVGGKQ